MTVIELNPKCRASVALAEQGVEPFDCSAQEPHDHCGGCSDVIPEGKVWCSEACQRMVLDYESESRGCW